MNELKSVPVRYNDIYCFKEELCRYLVVCSLVVKALLMLIACLALQLASLVLRPDTHNWGYKPSSPDPDSVRSVDPDPAKMTNKSRKRLRNFMDVLLKASYPAFQNMKFLHIFIFLRPFFCLAESAYESNDTTVLNPDPTGS
jgi:hypothetical protein